MRLTWEVMPANAITFSKRWKDAKNKAYETERVRDNQVEVNVKAAEKMAKLHDALKGHGYEGHDLEVYLVRLLFCLFADDTGIFPQDGFLRYIGQSRSDGSDFSERIGKLFEVLNNPGTTCMWRGLARLPAMAQGYRLALDLHGLRQDL